MTRREQFNLEFHKSIMPDGTMEYDCEAMTDVNQDLVFATILRGFDKYDSEDIIEIFLKLKMVKKIIEIFTVRIV